MNALLDPKIKPDSLALWRGQFAARIDRDTAAADVSHLSLSNGGIFLCITVYNEPASALHSSLAGLASSIASLRRTSPQITVNICVLVDGLQRCSPSMVTALERLVGTDERLLFESHDLTCHYRKMDVGELSAFEGCDAELYDDEIRWRATLIESQTAVAEAHEQRAADTDANFLIALKRDNRGKLDSHWWFYRVFCPRVVPTYCFQMDVGTVPTPHAFRELVEAFERDARVGAVASSILPPAPSSAFKLLQCWQYASFANSMLLEWPAESASGYLSVIPGQLSAVRWEAIQGAGPLDRSAEHRDALDVYFKGLGPLTPQESMLYLAEDRVLCREIVSQPQIEWTISHVDKASAITDPCLSWEELLRQRKRWCNGYMACRVNYVRHLPAFIGNPAVMPHRKARAVTAGIYHSLVLTHDWCTLAIFVLFMVSLVQRAISLVHASPMAQGGLTIFFYGAVCALLAQFSLCYRGDLSARSIAFFRFSVTLQASVVVASLFINVVFGETMVYALLLVFLCAAAPLASLMGHRRLTKPILASTPAVFLTIYIVPLLMWMYAICNAHDSSWGTKGLLTDTRTNGQEPPMGGSQKGMFLRYRNSYVSLWVGSNLALACLVYWWSESTQHDVAIILLGMTSAITLFGLVCRACGRLSGALKSATGNAKKLYTDSINNPMDKFPHKEPSKDGVD